MCILTLTISFNAQFLLDKLKNWFSKRLIMQIYFKKKHRISNDWINLNSKLNRNQNHKKIYHKMMRTLLMKKLKKLKKKKRKLVKRISMLEFYNKMNSLNLWTLHKIRSGQNELNSIKSNHLKWKIENQDISKTS